MSPAREVGPFEVLEKLGAGGMGEVFKARDRRLNRLVALKFLPEAARDSARERFQREALAIAALNHPNICTLYEAGEHEGQPYLVMELLEGESLHARLARGPVALPQIVAWGTEIADALQAAHAKGILHRDLKPGNIFITQRGSAKVLDFGLAQFSASSSSDADAATMAGTVAGAGAGPPPAPLTHPGTALGTAAYMSPEQARGEPLDPRSDIFSLGVVLYEMAGGQPPFQGRTSADLSAAILMRVPPPPSSLRPEIPARLDDIIAQCLEKDPDLRIQSAADLRASLRRVGAAPTSSAGAATAPTAGPASRALPAASTHVPIPSSAAPAAAPVPPGRRWLWPAAAVGLVAAGGLAWWRLRPRPAATAEPPAAAVQLSFRQLTFTGHVQDAVISPDGKFLAYVDASPLGTSLHLLSIASASDVQIVAPGNGCCGSPSFTPDGSQVYFLQDRVLKAVPLLGGTARIVVAQACSGAGFSPDGSQIAFVAKSAAGQQLMLARSDGTEPQILVAPRPGENYLSRCTGGPGRSSHPPAWSPDGGWIATGRSTANEFHIEAANSRDGHTIAVGQIAPEGAVSWLPGATGLVAIATGPNSAKTQVWRIAFPRGAATQLTDDLQGYSLVSASNGGELALVHGAPQYSIWTQAQAGGAMVQVPGGGATQDGAAGLAWAASGGFVSTHIMEGEPQVWSEAADGSGDRMLAPGRSPAVAPNGHVVFISAGLWHTAPDGTGRTALWQASAANGSTNFFALADGGQEVVFLLHAPASQTLWSVPLAGGMPRQLWSRKVFGDGIAASPDGKRIFVLAQGATANAHAPVMLALSGGQVQVTPLAMDFYTMLAPYGWTPDGRAITYIKNQGSVDNIWAFPLNGAKPYALTHFTELRIAAYAFSKDGRLAVSRGSDNSDAVLATGLAGGAGHGH